MTGPSPRPLAAAAAAAALACIAGASQAQSSGTYQLRHLTPEAAQKAVRAALDECRRRGFQVAVAVVDRSGIAQAMLRDRLAGPHTPDAAIGKGWTAVSFRTDTLQLVGMTAPGAASAGIRDLPRVVALGGGVQIQAAGATVGAIGVSGAPSGEADDACAKAGIAAIREELEL